MRSVRCPQRRFESSSFGDAQKQHATVADRRQNARRQQHSVLDCASSCRIALFKRIAAFQIFERKIFVR
jgi:hypothetical protein